MNQYVNVISPPRTWVSPQSLVDTFHRVQDAANKRNRVLVWNWNEKNRRRGDDINETSVTFAYRDIQFREAPRRKRGRWRKVTGVVVGGHAIK